MNTRFVPELLIPSQVARVSSLLISFFFFLLSDYGQFEQHGRRGKADRQKTNLFTSSVQLEISQLGSCFWGEGGGETTTGSQCGKMLALPPL